MRYRRSTTPGATYFLKEVKDTANALVPLFDHLFDEADEEWQDFTDSLEDLLDELLKKPKKPCN